MKKTIKFLMAILCVAICCTGCFDDGTSRIWGNICGSYALEGSSQYNNGVLDMKYLNEDCVMFEFRLMEGTESETAAYDSDSDSFSMSGEGLAEGDITFTREAA